MHVTLRYGRRGLDLELNQRTHVFRTHEMSVLDDSVSRLADCLASPIGSPPLRDIASGRRNACIVVSDITRPVPNELMLPSIIEILRDAGIPCEDISILVATGIHRAPTDEELTEMLGKEIVAEHEITSHDARDRSSFKRIGHTSNGTPIDINRTYLESDLKIVVGLVEPHFMAGYSGARKSVAIGLTSVESVKHLHGTKFLERRESRNCHLAGNPLHAELTEMAGAAGVDFCVNVVINAERTIGAIFSGDVVESHQASCEFAEKHCLIRSDRPYDIVVTTAAGHPLDTTYYQAVKGLVGALGILSPGGCIVLASECANGLGSKEFRQGLERLRVFDRYDDYIEYISDPANFEIDQWEVEMLVKALRKARIYMHSTGISDSDWPLTFTQRVDSLEDGLSRAGSHVRGDPRVAVIPEGPYAIPVCGEET